MEKRIRRRERRLNIRVISLGVVTAAAVAGALLEGPRASRFIEESRSKISQMMRLEEVTWEEVGSSNLSSRVSRELLWSVSGLKLGQEMLPIDLADLEGKLLSVPWLESVQIQKKLPSTIYVRYTVHHARALSVRKGRLWSISSAGKWIAPLNRDASLDLPVLGHEESLALELLWLDALEKGLNPYLLQVHEIDFAAGKNGEGARGTAVLEVQYQSKALKLTVVAAGEPRAESLVRLKKVVQYLIKNNILVSAIDLRPGKKVVVNVKKRS